jgi:hypothetical protein
MRRQDPKPDVDLAEILRRLDPPDPTPQQLSALARRIMTRATPLLEARRRSALAWWEYAAAWAGALLPLGVAAAVLAAACIVWLSGELPTVPHASERVALLRAVTSQAPSRELIDFALTPRSDRSMAGSRDSAGRAGGAR